MHTVEQLGASDPQVQVSITKSLLPDASVGIAPFTDTTTRPDGSSTVFTGYKGYDTPNDRGEGTMMWRSVDTDAINGKPMTLNAAAAPLHPQDDAWRTLMAATMAAKAKTGSKSLARASSNGASAAKNVTPPLTPKGTRKIAGNQEVTLRWPPLPGLSLPGVLPAFYVYRGTAFTATVEVTGTPPGTTISPPGHPPLRHWSRCLWHGCRQCLCPSPPGRRWRHASIARRDLAPPRTGA